LSARAELAFEKTMVELHPKSTDGDAVANFKYENKGKTTVKIKSVRTSCGCTIASLKKDEVAPGEKGEVTATFHVAGRTGTQDKGITVETDDPAQPVINLTLRAVIEQTIQIQPTFVFWQAGEAAKPKTISIKAAKDVKLTKIDVSSSSEDFTTRVDKISADQYTISVQPKDTAQMLNATLTIKTDLPQPYYATARVVSGPAGAVR
jgi:uncharacterized cupredoxin-like copper-binding protein